MAPATLNDWIQICGTVAFVTAASFACLKRTRKRAIRLRDCTRAHDKFVEKLGPNYPTVIFDLLTDLGTSHDLHEAHAEIILRRLGIGIYVADATSGKCLHVTDRLAEIFGLPAHSMLGFGWASQIDDRAAKVEEWNWCIAHQLTYRSNYTVTNATTGSRINCHCEAVYLAVDGGRYVGYVEILSEAPK